MTCVVYLCVFVTFLEMSRNVCKFIYVFRHVYKLSEIYGHVLEFVEKVRQMKIQIIENSIEMPRTFLDKCIEMSRNV